MATFHLHNFGCRASQADGAAVKKQLLDAGLAEARTGQAPDVVVVNTCTVTAAADAEARQVIRRVHRQNPQCRILVTGCYAQRAPDEVAGIHGVRWVIGNSHKHLVADLLQEGVAQQVRCQELLRGPDSGLVQLGEPHGWQSADVRVGEIPEGFHFAPVFPDDRTRPTLKVQDGCNARCSFCVIPTVRGGSRSLAPERVVEEIRRLEQQGYQEVVLSGINLGSYGHDLGRSINFLGLIRKILLETGVKRLRISSIEPMDVGPELIRLVATESRLAQHFHVPLQSGSDRILRLMNRRYWAAHYAERILAIRAQIPNCAIGADVMVGFPGETDADHQTSVRFIESLPFTYLHVFPYSRRPGTAAAERPDQVDGNVIRRRSEEVRSVIAGKHQQFREAQVGCTLAVLTLDDTEDGSPVALTSNYLKMVLPGSDVAPNTLLNAHVQRTHAGLLYGRQELPRVGPSEAIHPPRAASRDASKPHADALRPGH